MFHDRSFIMPERLKEHGTTPARQERAPSGVIARPFWVAVQGRKPLVVWAIASLVGRRLPIPLQSFRDPYLGNHLEGSKHFLQRGLLMCWLFCLARVMSLTGEGVNHQWFGEHFVAREGEQVVDMGTVAR